MHGPRAGVRHERDEPYARLPERAGRQGTRGAKTAVSSYKGHGDGGEEVDSYTCLSDRRGGGVRRQARRPPRLL